MQFGDVHVDVRGQNPSHHFRDFSLWTRSVLLNNDEHDLGRWIDQPLDVDQGQMDLQNLGDFSQLFTDCVRYLFRNRLGGRSDVSSRTSGDFHNVGGWQWSRRVF